MPHEGTIRYEAFGEAHLASSVELCRALSWPSYGESSTTRAVLSAPGAVTCVALEGGRGVGLAHLLTDGAVQAHLSLVGVLPACRRRGIARELLLRAFRDAGAKWLDLSADPGSEPFYRSFVHEERRAFRLHPAEPTG